MLAGNPSFAAGDYESIQTYNPSGTTSVTFSSIPSTYTHLQLRMVANKVTPTDFCNIRFNGDTATNYNTHFLTGNGSSATSQFNGTLSGIYSVVAVTNSNIFGAAITDVLDYANVNKFKTTRELNGFDTNGAGEMRLISGLWRNTAAINSITVYSATNFNTGTSIALYGVK